MRGGALLLLLALVVALSPLALCKKTALGGESTIAPPEGKPAADKSVYPSNISDAFKGVWEFASANETSELGFEQRSGVLFFHLTSKRTDSEDRHEVIAEALLRDGMYPTARDLRTTLTGYYTWRTGQLVLFSDVLGAAMAAAEGAHVAAKNGTDGDATSLAALAAAFRKSAAAVEGSAGAGQRCILQLFLQAKPVDPASVDAYAKEREREATTDGSGGLAGDEEAGERKGHELEGVMVSPNCMTGAGLRMNATAILFEAYFNKAINYTLMVTFLSFVEVLLLIKQMEFTSTQSGASKVSLLTVGSQAIMDSYLCLLHLTTGIVVERLFNAFATAAFFKFVIFAIFEMRYLLAIWKARRPQQFADGFTSMRRELSVLYSRFYGFLLAGIILMYQMQASLRYFVFVLYSFWWPQIVNNAQRDVRRSMHWQYVLGMSATRLAIPLYFFACPHNFLHVETNGALSASLVAWVALQALLLLLQDLLGPRFFIPARLLPEKYNYARRLPGPPRECIICMSPVADDDEPMTCPCNHTFHAPCLQQWIEIKLECPTCRAVLPAP
eukprot:tig00000711_g3433.t1